MIKTLLSRSKQRFIADRNNRKGANLSEKYLVIESDDWGAIRTSSLDSISRLKKNGIDLSNSIYKNDALESNEDLDQLFDLLLSFKNQYNEHPVFTANTIVANPDFDKIKASTYTTYFFEPVSTTIKKYPSHDQLLNKWQKGSQEKIFVPQFHGREHLQYNRWLKALQSKQVKVLQTFEEGMTFSGEADYSFMETYDWDSKADIEKQKNDIESGLQLFSELMGYRSESFIAPCYNWDPEIEPTLFNNGVSIIQGLRNQLVPTGHFDRYESQPHFFGEKNKQGIIYNIRNCFLEPSMLPSKDWVDSCLAQIDSAFRWNKPAVICSHRINYIGFINPKNRDRGLYDLKKLLQKVLKKWPDVRFISTNQLVPLLNISS